MKHDVTDWRDGFWWQRMKLKIKERRILELQLSYVLNIEQNYNELFYWLTVVVMQLGFEPRTGTDTYKWWQELRGTRLMFWRTVVSEVQFNIFFGFACCHDLLRVNLFFGLKVTNEDERCLARYSHLCTPWHVCGKHRRYTFDQSKFTSACQIISIWVHARTESEILTSTEISAIPIYRGRLNWISSWRKHCEFNFFWY